MLQDQIRLTILTALFTDDTLCRRLVLKGGNALTLVYGVGDRTSLDLDFSIADDFDDLDDIRTRIERSLVTAFDRQDIEVFEFSMEPKPSVRVKPWWGGYLAEFKLIPRLAPGSPTSDLRGKRMRALTVSPGSQNRKYRIEISRFEYVSGSDARRIGDADIVVYSPVLLAAEKLRALVQQHPEYPEIPLRMKRSRSRDLYDIWVLSDHFAIRLEEHDVVVRAVFAAKHVDVALLSRFRETEALHQGGWADVENSVSRPIESFRFYYDFVAAIAAALYAKWEVDAP